MNNKLFVGLVVPLSLFFSITSVAMVNSKDAPRLVAGAQLSSSQKKVSAPTYNNKLLGFYTNNGDAVTAIESRIGEGSGIIAWFSTWSESLINNKLKSTCSSTAVPLITWESWGGKSKAQEAYPLTDIAAGKYDDYIKDQMSQVAKICASHPILIRFDHEMEAGSDGQSWYPWQTAPEEYINAWRHVVTISRQQNTNVSFVWSPNRGNSQTILYYPGPEYVDYVGITLNNASPGLSGWKSFADFYQANSQVIEGFKKPVIISETGVAEYTPGFKAEWVGGMYNFAAEHDAIVGLVSIDNIQTYDDGSVADYRIDSSHESYLAYKNAMITFMKRRN